MDKSLIERIKTITNQEDQVVSDFLGELPLDTLYAIFDAHRTNDEAKLGALVEPIMSTVTSENVDEDSLEEQMKKDDTKITMDLPKPRNPMARELEKGQYQPKVTPNKKEVLDRQSRKHKGRIDDSFASGEETVLEGVMGMYAMPAIKKMLTLAGRPAEEDDIKKAMEDFMGDFGDLTGLSINDITTPVGTTITVGPLETPVNDAGAVNTADDEFDAETSALVAGMGAVGGTPAYASIRQSVEQIKLRINDIKVTEFTQVKGLIGELQSMLDSLGNQVK
jgi:hypothetical protein